MRRNKLFLLRAAVCYIFIAAGHIYAADAEAAEESNEGGQHTDEIVQHSSNGDGHDEEGEVAHDESAYAVLYPWFVQAIGILVFFILTRYVHFIPYIRPIVHSLSHSGELLLAIDGSTVSNFPCRVYT